MTTNDERAVTHKVQKPVRAFDEFTDPLPNLMAEDVGKHVRSILGTSIDQRNESASGSTAATSRELDQLFDQWHGIVVRHNGTYGPAMGLQLHQPHDLNL
jgi:hypothetical protein